MTDIASLGLAIDSSKAEEAVKRLDALAAAAAKAETGTKNLGSMSQSMGQQLSAMIQIQAQQTAALVKLVEAQAKATKEAEAGQKAYGGLFSTMKSGSTTMAGTSAGMIEMARASETAWKAAEKLDDQFDSVFGALTAGSVTLRKVADDMRDLERATGQGAEGVLALNRAIDQTALSATQKSASFTRLNAIISDTTGQMEGYQKRLEQYVGALDGQSAGDIGAKLVTALNNTKDSAQRTADALGLLGIQGAEALKKLGESGRLIYSTEMKEMDSLQAELIRRQESTIGEKLAEKKAKAIAEKYQQELGAFGRFIKNDPILDFFFNPFSVTTGGIRQVNLLGQDAGKAIGLDWFEKLFDVTDKMKIQLALVNDDARRVYKTYEDGLPKMIGFFDSLYVKAKGYVDVLRGTYAPKTITSGYDGLTELNKDADPDILDTFKARAPATAEQLAQGRQLIAQFDSLYAANERYNKIVEVANKLAKAGAINLEDWRKVMRAAGDELTRTTGKMDPWVESIRQANEAVSTVQAGLVANAEKAVADVEASLVKLRAKTQEYQDLLNGVLPGGTRGLAGRGQAEAQRRERQAERDREAADIIATNERISKALTEDLTKWQSSLMSPGNMAPSQALAQETKRLQEAADDANLLADGFKTLGDGAERDLTRAVAIIQAMRKEFGLGADSLIEAFKSTGEIPARMKALVEALDAKGIADATLAAEKFVATQTSQIAKQEELIKAIRGGDDAMIAYNKTQDEAKVAADRGFASFDQLKSSLGEDLANRLATVATRMREMAGATDLARQAAEAMKRADMAGAVADLGPMSGGDKRESQIVLDGMARAKALDSSAPDYLQQKKDLFAKMAAEMREVREAVRQGVNDFDWNNTWDKAFSSFNRRFAAASSVTQQQMSALSQAAQELNRRNMGGEAVKVLEGNLSGLSEEGKKVVRQFQAIKKDEIGGDMARMARDTNLETRALERMAEAAGKGEAAMRAAARANAIERERTVVGRDISGAEISKEIALITQATNEYRGAAVQAQTVTTAYAAAIEAGATSSAQLSLAQEELNIKLKIGQQIEGDSAQMTELRNQKIRESIEALRARVKAEGDSQLIGQSADIQRDLEYQKQVTAEVIKGGAALAQIEIAHEKNEAALRFYKTTFDALAQSEDQEDKKRAARIEQFVLMTREMKAQATVQAEAKRTKTAQDDLQILRTEISLIGKGREERETIIELMKLEIRFKEDSKNLSSDQLKLLQDQYEAQKQLIPERIKLTLQKSDLEAEAEMTKEIWRNAIGGIQSAFSGFFESVLSGGTSTWKELANSLKRVMFQVIAQITAAMVFRPIVASALNGMGASQDFMRSMGMGSLYSGPGAATSTPSSSGMFGMPMVPGGSGGLFDGILNTQLFGGSGGAVGSGGALYGADAVFGPGSDMAMGATSSTQAAGGMTIGGAMPAIGAGLSIYGAIQNPNVGTIAGAAATTFGAAASMFPAMFGSLAPLGPYGMIAGAVLSILGNTLFKKKPSNLGAESSFTFDQLEAGAEIDFSRLYRGDKHPKSLSLVDNIALAGQDTLDALSDQYQGVRFGGTISARYGKKEGSSISYGAPDAKSVDDWKVFKFDAENEEETAQAYADFSLAALKGADWSGVGETVAIAVKNSVADNLEDFLADVDFAKAFDDTIEFFNNGMDPVNSQLGQIKRNAEANADSVAKTITDFLDKTKELFPPIVRSFNAAGDDITDSMETVIESLTVGANGISTYSQEVDSANVAMGSSLTDSTGALYTFTGAIGDATLELVDAAGNTTTATLNTATGLYELTRTVNSLGDAASSTTEVLSEQQEQASLATKNFAIGVLGLTDSFRMVTIDGVEVLKAGVYETIAPLKGLDLALETSRQGIEALRPALEQAGFSAEEIAILIPAAMARAADQVRETFAQMQMAEDFSWHQRFNPGAVPSGAQAFAGIGSTAELTPNFYREIDSFLSKAMAGAATQADYNALEDNFTYQGQANILTDAQLDRLWNVVGSALSSSLARQNTTLPINDDRPLFGVDSGGSDGGGGGGGGGGSDNSDLVESLREQRSTTVELIRTLEGTANTFGRLAKALDDYRKSLLLNDSLTTLTPEQQLAEARAQYQDALGRAKSTDKDIAAEGMNDLRDASSTLLEKSRGFWASSVAYQEDFSMVQEDLLSITNKAKTIEEQALAQLATANSTLLSIDADLKNLQTTSNPGSPSTPGGGTTTGGTPGPGYTSGASVTGAPAGMTFLSSAFPYAGQGILFGVGGLNRGLTQDTASFMASRFPKYTGATTEYAAYQWMQEAHESGLKAAGGNPLTRNAYFSAATKSGYTGAFGAGQHAGFLNADLTGGAWMRFITALRGYTGAANLKPGWFFPNGATDLPAGMNQSILTFAKGGVMTSPTMMAMGNGRIGLMAEAGPEAIMPLARGPSGRMGVEMIGGAVNDNMVRELRAMLRLQAAAFSEMIELARMGNRTGADIERKTGRQSFDGRRAA